MGRTYPQGSQTGRRLMAAAVVAGLGVASAGQSDAAILYWSANGATQGGGLTGATAWTTTDAHWGPNGGPWAAAWNNANVDSAVFDTAAGTVHINGGSASAAGTPLVVNTITTGIAGYSIGNGNGAGTSNRINFSGTNAGINTAVTGLTTITAVMGGTVVKSGPGRLELGNANNPNTIKYILTGGALTSASMARLSGTAPAAPVADFFTFNGGGWAINTGNQDTGANRGITIKSGGAFFGTSANSITTTISSPIVGTEGGGLTLTNAGPFTGNTSSTGGGVVTLMNSANSWDGPTTVANSTSTLTNGAANVIPNGSAVTVTAGTWNNNNFAETIGSLAGAGAVTNVSALTAGGNNTNTTFSGTMAGTGTFTKAGTGTMILSGGSANARSGATSVNGGVLSLDKTAGVNALNGSVTVGDGAGTDILRLVKANQIVDTGDITLNGGKLETSGVSETVDLLTLSASSIIDLGAGASILKFSDSSAQSWTGTLSVYNWSGDNINGGGTDQLFFGTLPSGGLTPAQLASVNFYSDAGVTLLGGGGAQFIGSAGEIVPVPEPTSLALLGLGAIAFGARRRRK